MASANDTTLNEGTDPPDKEVPNTRAGGHASNPRPSRKRRVISLVILAFLLLSILVPLGIAVNYGIDAYSTYKTLSNEAHSGVQHLLDIKTIFTGVKTHPADLLDAAKLHQTQQALTAAHSNFQQLQSTLDHSSLIHTVTSYFSQYREQVATARSASQIGLDVVSVGQTLTAAIQQLAPQLHAPLLDTSGAKTQQPLVTASMIQTVQATLDSILPRLNKIQGEAQGLNLNALPISTAQRQQFLQLLQLLPQVVSGAQQVRSLLAAATWLLGVVSPRTFLVQPMDTSELRASGGFTGQYGEVQISGGRAESWFLRDISLVEYAANSPAQGQLPPQQYRSWWPFANWGLRDSNVSADFPTSAQIAISLYKQELGRQVDGLIAFTPTPIQQVLQVVGPIFVPGYNETITAQNLLGRLHYYQEDPAGLAKQNQIQPGDTTTSARKRFTSLLAELLIARVRQATPQQLVAIGEQLLSDLKTKDIQVYFTNPQVENLLMQYGDAAQIDRSTTHDGLLVVQENLSANKSSGYVQTLLQDTVTLDAAGGATHVLHMQLAYKPFGTVYGYKTYFDYIRTYVPAGSKFLSGDGFDTGMPLCGGAFYPACSQQGVYPNNELVCPPGQVQVGPAPPSYLDPDGATWLPFDKLGPPTNMTSDEPGRAMFGGWVIVPMNCTMNVTLSWYVPPSGHTPYSLLIQNQAGTIPQLDLTVYSAPGRCNPLTTAYLHIDTLLKQDTLFTLENPGGSANASC